MPTLPWRVQKNSINASSATAMLTYLPLKHYWDTPRFMLYIIQIQFQLRRTPGLLGFSMRARLFSKQYWTLSLWENESAVLAYIHTAPHVNIMGKMTGRMGQTAFVNWSVADPSKALSWSDALARNAKGYQQTK